MGTGPTTQPSSQLRRDLRAMLGDGVSFSVMVGIGESYLPAFALALGHGDVTAGLVATVPMLAGALLQLASPAAVGLLDSHRRWIVLCAALQAICFVPLIIAALSHAMDLVLLYLVASLYWGLGMSTVPAWTTWASSLVPKRLRPVFFANRARASQLALVLSLIGGGMILQLGKGRGAEFEAYAVIFAVALCARGVSASFLYSQREPHSLEVGETSISPAVISKHVRTGGHGRLLAFLLSFQMGVSVASPYFTPYMLSDLELSYLEFTVLMAAAFGARVLSLPALGRYVRRVGTKKVLWRAGLVISTLPIQWLFSDHFAWLLVLQLLSGAAWAAFELASLLSFFERIPPTVRRACSRSTTWRVRPRSSWAARPGVASCASSARGRRALRRSSSSRPWPGQRCWSSFARCPISRIPARRRRFGRSRSGRRRAASSARS